MLDASLSSFNKISLLPIKKKNQTNWAIVWNWKVEKRKKAKESMVYFKSQFGVFSFYDHLSVRMEKLLRENDGSWRVFIINTRQERAENIC